MKQSVKIRHSQVLVSEFKVGDFWLNSRGHGFRIIAIDDRIIGERTLTSISMIDGATSKNRFSKYGQLPMVHEVNGRKPGAAGVVIRE